MLDVQLPNLLPELRPYQCRAAHWMIQREKGVSECSGSGKDQFVNPLCMPLNLIEASATLYYHPFWYTSFSTSSHANTRVFIQGIINCLWLSTTLRI